ncbi:hypothetical protein HHK36_017609 [Tetracentron sinense]|uniref:Protein FAR1-RELATED SEQUENCE n=1 Tax=Tetracentron sinense TaxID=13715 RepID=A0A835DA26_TETSI|nr:hypothetical protein HHK36_017609 [Tetracentron sinense]
MNDSLATLYEVRQQWVPVVLKDTFFLLEMSTTQRSESMNSFFDGYVYSKTALKEFLDQYDLVLHEKYEKEAQADFDSFYTNPMLKTSCCFERQIAEVYTREMFIKFQNEVYGMECCSNTGVKVAGKERIFSKDGKMLEPKIYEVFFNVAEVEVR